MSDKATRISALMDELLKVSSEGLTDYEQGLIKDCLTKMQKMSPEFLKILQLSASCTNQNAKTIKRESFVRPETGELISKACLVSELNHSHFPGAPYVDAEALMLFRCDTESGLMVVVLNVGQNPKKITTCVIF